MRYGWNIDGIDTPIHCVPVERHSRSQPQATQTGQIHNAAQLSEKTIQNGMSRYIQIERTLFQITENKFKRKLNTIQVWIFLEKLSGIA